MKSIVKKKISNLYRVFPLVAVFWTLFIISLQIWEFREEKYNLQHVLLTNIRTFVDHIVAVRAWNSHYGGVYVPTNEISEPNPYQHVENKNITSTDGQQFTLLNPAEMTRQITRFTESYNRANYRITSLKPINPENAPTNWEAHALANFTSPKDEYWEMSLPDDPDQQEFRYISPEIVKESCLSCHAEQNYNPGEIRGGVSITIPLDGILNEQRKHIGKDRRQSIFIWFIGMLGIFIAFLSIRKEYREKSDLITELETALADVKTLSGFIPICASCKKIRNDNGFWDQLEKYIGDHSDAKFSHSICPDCRDKLYPQLAPRNKNISNSDHDHSHPS